MDINPQLLQEIRERAHRAGRSFREELERVLARGLREREAARAPSVDLPTFRMGVRPDIDLDKALALATDLDDAAQARALQQFR